MSPTGKGDDSGARGPTARILALLSLLQAHRHWRGSELADRLGVSERTVRRDVERLRDLGYPVDAEPGVDGGYRLAVGANVPPLVIEDDEAVALFIGLRSAALSSVEGVSEATVALMAKVGQIMPDRLRRRVDALGQSVEFMSAAPSDSSVPIASLTVLSQGCRDQEEVRFDYRSRQDESTSRLVQPHQLVSAGRRWYLVAWDVRRDDWRTFRVDRMDTPTLAGARFERGILPAEDAAAFIKQSIRALRAGHEATVVVSASLVELESISRWLNTQPVPIDHHQSRILLVAETSGRLASMIAMLALDYDIVDIDAADDVRDQIATVAGRLQRSIERDDRPVLDR